MKLSQENIQFINTYLENSNVVYIDIRYEMIDHIVSGVEKMMEEKSIDFYDAFKNYMLVNKVALLKNNKTSTSLSWSVISKYLKFLVSPIMILVAFILILTIRFIDVQSFFSQDFTFNNLLFLLFIAIVLFHQLYHRVYMKKRYYSIESAGQILLVIYLIFPVVSNQNLTVSMFLLFILLGYLLYYINVISVFKKHALNRIN